MAAITVDKPLPAGWQRDQWHARRDALLMLPHRPRVLLACEWARRVLPIFQSRRPTDSRPENAIRAGRAWVFVPSDENRQMVRDSTHAADAAYAAARAAEAEADLWPWLYRTYQRAIGPAGVVFDPHWRTAEAVGIARGIADTLALDRLPILADALEDAGFSHDATLLAMRDEPDTATLADWQLWGLLGLWAE